MKGRGMEKPVRQTRVIDQFGFDITERIIADYGSVESWQEYAAQVRALLFDHIPEFQQFREEDDAVDQNSSMRNRPLTAGQKAFLAVLFAIFAAVLLPVVAWTLRHLWSWGFNWVQWR